MRLIDSDSVLQTYKKMGLSENSGAYGVVESSPTVEQIKPWETIELVLEVLNRLGRTSGRCNGVICRYCPFYAEAEHRRLSCSSILFVHPDRFHKIATTWLADNPLKPKPTEGELLKLKAWADLEYPWFAVDKDGNCRVYSNMPVRVKDKWVVKAGAGRIAEMFVGQEFTTWEDEPMFTEPRDY